MQSIRRVLAAAAALPIALGLPACSTQHATYAADGRKAYVITCEGYLSSYSTCLVKAGRACGGRGYDTLRGGEDDRSLLIACKAP
jgi:hypothetical protein